MSVALAVLGELLNEAEQQQAAIAGLGLPNQAARLEARVAALREARNRVMAAESRFARDDEGARLDEALATGEI